MTSPTQMRRRYPGPKPFEPNEKDLFFGRDQDAESIIRMLELQTTVTLHAQSGLGKTSLLNTLVLPHFEQKNYELIRVRFHNYNGPSSDFPPSALANNLPEIALRKTFLHQIEDDAPSLWQQCKNIQVARREAGEPFAGILFVFDQFEELFTYPKGADQVASQLEKLLNNREPSFFRRKKNQLLKQNPAALSHEQLEWLEEPLRVKILFSLRSDRMSLLGRLADTLPTILRYTYELMPFGELQAQQAITGPARLQEQDFATPAFSFEPAALEKILDFLTAGGTQAVDPFQIQLICPTIEDKFLAGASEEPIPTHQQGMPEVGLAMLPNLSDLYTDYYLNTLKKLDPSKQKSARLLVEEGLILADVQRRISVDEGKLMRDYGIDLSLLESLVSQRLIRSDQNHLQATSYELSHDSLIVPILKKRQERVDQDRLKQYFRQAGLYSLIALVLLIVGFAGYVFYQNAQLKKINYQLLSAFNQLGWNLDDEGSMTDQSVLDRTIDLTNEISSTRLALRDVDKNLRAFQEKTRGIQDSLEQGLLTMPVYLLRMEAYQRGLDRLLDVKEVKDMANSAEFLPLPDTSVAEINLRIEALYAEGERLEGEATKLKAQPKIPEARKKSHNALHKYEQIEYWAKSGKWVDLVKTKQAEADQARARESIERVNQFLESLNPPPPSPAPRAPSVKDRDQDGVPDDKDRCPDKKGEAGLEGCPNVDTDGDGVLDYLDKCPDEKGTLELEGCNDPDRDRDGDKIPDIKDNCPDTKGLEKFQGCPDTDGDDISDEQDACPNIKGQRTANGCPDQDGDGVADQDDTCPTKPGPASNGGCPVAGEDTTQIAPVDPDPDKDGILGEADECPEEEGLELYNGCPPPVPAPKVVFVQGGTFARTDENGRNEHQVTINSFYIGATEITFAEYYAYRLDNKLTQLNVKDFLQNLTFPAFNISWDDANAFCKWLSDKDPQYNYRLPTEAEWEFAARGGANGGQFQYAGSDDPNEVAYHTSSALKLSNPFYEVGSKKANSLEIYDMSGGVAEWCSDWFEPTAYEGYAGQSLNNPKGPPSSSKGERAIRGGHYASFANFCKITDQNGDTPTKNNRRYGFRVVRY